MNGNELLMLIRQICTRPRMYAPSFTLEHLFLLVFGYEMALADMKQPSQISEFESWLKAQNPEWRHLSSWWGANILAGCGGDQDQARERIINLIDRFLAERGTKTESP